MGADLPYNLKQFTGFVQMRDAFLHPNGRWIHSIAGSISIYQDEELAGFKMRGTDSNWAAVIEGAQGRMVVLGCQVRLVHSGDLRNYIDTSCLDLR